MGEFAQIFCELVKAVFATLKIGKSMVNSPLLMLGNGFVFSTDIGPSVCDSKGLTVWLPKNPYSHWSG